jgi:hypothetical protein
MKRSLDALTSRSFEVLVVRGGDNGTRPYYRLTEAFSGPRSGSHSLSVASSPVRHEAILAIHALRTSGKGRWLR